MGIGTARYRLVIARRVQGMYYRAWLMERARALGVAGWVRNRADGSVEAVVQGSEEQVEAMLALARQVSPVSRVDDVAMTDDANEEALYGFYKRPTLWAEPCRVQTTEAQNDESHDVLNLANAAA